MLTWIGCNWSEIFHDPGNVPIRLWGYISAAPFSVNQKISLAAGFHYFAQQMQRMRAPLSGGHVKKRETSRKDL
jgi:hypothetical protein